MDNGWHLAHTLSRRTTGANSEPYHDTWDPNTLAGTDALTYSVPACGNPAGYRQTNTQTNTLQLSQAPASPKGDNQSEAR
jgi:hypothetical protein